MKKMITLSNYTNNRNCSNITNNSNTLNNSDFYQIATTKHTFCSVNRTGTGKDSQMNVKIFHTVDGTRYCSTYFAPTTFDSEQSDVLHECPLESHKDSCYTEDVTLAIQEALTNPSSTLEIENGNCIIHIKP